MLVLFRARSTVGVLGTEGCGGGGKNNRPQPITNQETPRRNQLGDGYSHLGIGRVRRLAHSHDDADHPVSDFSLWIEASRTRYRREGTRADLRGHRSPNQAANDQAHGASGSACRRLRATAQFDSAGGRWYRSSAQPGLGSVRCACAGRQATGRYSAQWRLLHRCAEKCAS